MTCVLRIELTSLQLPSELWQAFHLRICYRRSMAVASCNKQPNWCNAGLTTVASSTCARCSGTWCGAAAALQSRCPQTTSCR